MKTKSLRNIEEIMGNIEESSIRYHVLENSKRFKTSWIDLGQALYSVWKDKLYKDWGFSTFDAYTTKEIGVRKETAFKLLRSYSFLEKEAPLYIQKEYNEQANAATVPTFESVDVLRRACNNKELDKSDYENIRKYVLEKGKNAKDVKKDLTQMIKQQEELLPEDAWKKKKLTIVRRFISVLRSVREEIRVNKIFSVQILKDTEKLINKLENELS